MLVYMQLDQVIPLLQHPLKAPMFLLELTMRVKMCCLPKHL